MHWIVVADAARARIFRGDARLAELEELTALVHPGTRTRTSDRLSDSVGRRGQGGAEPHTTARDHERQAFAHQVGAHVLGSRSDFERLIVVAPPQFLGALRKELHAHLPKATVVIDVAKDLSKTPGNELGAAIRANLPDTAGMP